MRLWHKDLIPVLPRQQLLGQWRECCLIAKQIAENGTPNHVLVNRVMEYRFSHFYCYVWLVHSEMMKRGYRAEWNKFRRYTDGLDHAAIKYEKLFYSWHNNRYLNQCLYNLQEKHDCKAIPDDEWKQITDKYPWIE